MLKVALVGVGGISGATPNLLRFAIYARSRWKNIRTSIAIPILTKCLKMKK